MFDAGDGQWQRLRLREIDGAKMEAFSGTYEEGV